MINPAMTAMVPTICPARIVSSNRIQAVNPLMTGTRKSSGAVWAVARWRSTQLHADHATKTGAITTQAIASQPDGVIVVQS